MTIDSARAAAVEAKGYIGTLGGEWMSSDAEEEASEAAGLPGWQLYFLGRHGVLGDVDPDVILAAAYIFPADYLRQEWTAARKVMTPAEALSRYLEVCRGWGRERLAGFSDAGRLADLGQRVIDGADVIGLPLFAGWRAVPMPAGTDEGAHLERCAQVCQVLREHRGACHGVALAALQLSPLVAILCNPDGKAGEENASEYGWQPPFPEPTNNDRALRARVEELTDDLVAPAYEALSREEQSEFVALLARAHAHISA
ncbi:MAG TPA: hypothetical protein VFX15_07905 [Actinomycetes bacterium]|nr:hypothetical protein [Actinomycetes bacterium]